MLVYDITDEDSFQKVKVWVKELRRMVGADIERPRESPGRLEKRRSARTELGIMVSR